MLEPINTSNTTTTAKIYILAKVIFFLFSVIILGLLVNLFDDLNKSVSDNTNTISEINLRVARIEGRWDALKQSGSSAIPKESTRLHSNLIEKGDIKFKTIMTTGIQENNDALDMTETFSRSRHRRMYIYNEWFDLVGHHEVSILWITPDRKIYKINSYESEFKSKYWRTWHWIKMDNYMKLGVWFFQVYLDGSFLVGKQFEIAS